MSEKYYVYILECEDSNGKITYYTGYTKDPERRIKEHVEKRGALYTKGREVLRTRVVISFKSRKRAMKEERYIKKLSSKFKENLINEILNWKNGG